jgi:hypothetical protein
MLFDQLFIDSSLIWITEKCVIVHIEDSGQIEDINIDNKEIDKTDVCVDEYGTLKYSIE